MLPVNIKGACAREANPASFERTKTLWEIVTPPESLTCMLLVHTTVQVAMVIETWIF
jgi:hypothetical protein